MRKDIHYAFNNRWFVIVPKMVTTASSRESSRRNTFSPRRLKTPSSLSLLDGIYHLLSAVKLWPTYHTTIVASIHGRSREFLFTRLAWAIIFQDKVFVIEVCQNSRTPTVAGSHVTAGRYPAVRIKAGNSAVRKKENIDLYKPVREQAKMAVQSHRRTMIMTWTA